MRVCISRSVCACVCVCVCVYVYVYVYVYVCMYVCVYVCMHLCRILASGLCFNVWSQYFMYFCGPGSLEFCRFRGGGSMLRSFAFSVVLRP